MFSISKPLIKAHPAFVTSIFNSIFNIQLYYGCITIRIIVLLALTVPYVLINRRTVYVWRALIFAEYAVLLILNILVVTRVEECEVGV